MHRQRDRRLDDEAWTTVRPFADESETYAQPKYEAKLVDASERDYLADEVVLLRKTCSVSGGEQVSQFPREVFETVAAHLPE